MPTYGAGRHEHGQNFLHHQPTIDAVVDRVRTTSGPIIEIGAGDGALTRPLSTLSRPLTAVEIDHRLVLSLRSRLDPSVEVVHGDFLRHHLPAHAHVLVGNLPFHQTTAMLRHVLRAPGWTHAVLLVQWEVARRRAGVGAATLMTAQWWPWFDFDLVRRVPARAFTPAPSVDGGLIVITRRPSPLLPISKRKQFHAMAHRVFTGPGRGITDIATRAGLFPHADRAAQWATSSGVDHAALPRDLTAHQWVDLYRASGTSPPTSGRSQHPPPSRTRRRPHRTKQRGTK